MMKNFSVVLLGLLLSNHAFAVNSINVQTFNPSTSNRFVLLEDGFNNDWPRESKYFFGANYNYVSEPFVALNAAQTAKAFNIVESINTFDLMFGFKASKKFGLFIGLPIHFASYPSTPGLIGYPTGTGSGIGDLKLMAKIRLTEDDNNTSLALIPEFHLPTGSTANFLSDASTYVGLRLALERQFEAFTLSANAGFAFASNAMFQDAAFTSGIDYRKRLNLGIGGFIPFTDTWGMSVELNSISPVPFDKNLNPNELYAGLRHVADENWILTFGGSVGKIGGPTGLNYRIIAGVRYTIYDDAKPAPRPVYIPAATPAPTAFPVPTPEPKQIVIMHSTHVEVLRTINFEHASAKLTPDGKAVLNQVAKVLLDNKKAYTKILVDGHTNRLGSDPYNINLSMARAKSVKAYLISQKVPANALEARGYGYRKPKVPYTDPNAMEVNRRVEFIVVK